MSRKIEITCPCCETRLTVEAKTGEVLAEERPKPQHARNFDEAMKDVRSGSKRREDAFSKAFDRTKHLDDVLELKFEEAKKKAAKDKSKPKNPFDLD